MKKIFMLAILLCMGGYTLAYAASEAAATTPKSDSSVQQDTKSSPDSACTGGPGCINTGPQ